MYIQKNSGASSNNWLFGQANKTTKNSNRSSGAAPPGLVTKPVEVLITSHRDNAAGYEKQLSLLRANRNNVHTYTGTYEERLENAKNCFQFAEMRIHTVQDSIQKATDELGINEDFSFSWNCIAKKITVIGDFSEDKKDALSNALNSTQYLISHMANYDKIANGRIDEIFYPKYEKYLKEKYGQDISELQIVEDTIVGANKALQGVLSNNELDYPYDTRILKELVKDGEPTYNNISNYDFKDGKLLFKDGDIKLGEGQCSEEQRNDPHFIFKMGFMVDDKQWYFAKASNKEYY